MNLGGHCIPAWATEQDPISKKNRKKEKFNWLTVPQFCRLYRKHDAGICSASKEASGDLQSRWKVKGEQGFSHGGSKSKVGAGGGAFGKA